MKNNIKGLPNSIKKLLRDYAESLTAAIVIAIVLRIFVISAFRVPTAAMAPSLLPGDFIFGYKLPFVISEAFNNSPNIHRGEMIIFKCPDNKEFFCVKRVIAKAGDSIEIVNGRLSVNGSLATYENVTSPENLLPGMEFYTIKKEAIFDHSRLLIFSKKQEVTDVQPVKVPEGKVYVLGDNRDTSDDSRSWGAIAEIDVVASASFIWLSLDWQRTYFSGRFPSVRWGRIFTVVD